MLSRTDFFKTTSEKKTEECGHFSSPLSVSFIQLLFLCECVCETLCSLSRCTLHRKTEPSEQGEGAGEGKGCSVLTARTKESVFSCTSPSVLTKGGGMAREDRSPSVPIVPHDL